MYIDDKEKSFKLQKEEVSQVKWITKIEMEKIIKDRKVIPHIEDYNILRDFLKQKAKRLAFYL